MGCWCNDGVHVGKENLHFDNQSQQLIPLFCIKVFSKRNRKLVT